MENEWLKIKVIWIQRSRNHPKRDMTPASWRWIICAFRDSETSRTDAKRRQVRKRVDPALAHTKSPALCLNGQTKRRTRVKHRVGYGMFSKIIKSVG